MFAGFDPIVFVILGGLILIGLILVTIQVIGFKNEDHTHGGNS